MTRVLYLIKTLGIGGAERLLMDVALRLDRSRFAPEVAYAFDDWDELAGEIAAAGVPVAYLGGRGAWLRRLRSMLREGRCDVLHVHSPYVAAGARLLPRHGTALLYTEHNEWPAYRPATRWANALTYRRNDRVLAVSERARRSTGHPAWLRLLGAPPIETLHHGIDFDRLRASTPAEPFPRAELGLPDDALVVGTVANFRPEKGHRVLVDAAAQVHPALPAVRFVLVGGGPGEARVRDQVARLGLEDVVLFAGYRDDAAALATTFDVFALPSFQEGLPIALIESMALGKPVVATAVGGTPEAVEHGRQGLLVPSGNPGAFAAALRDLLKNRGKRTAMGREAAKRATDFDIRRAVARLEELYDAVAPA